MGNFATFFTQSIKDKTRKVKSGKYKGHPGAIKPKRNIQLPGVTYYSNPGKSDAPSSSTFLTKG